jgi:hypothetical protein
MSSTGSVGRDRVTLVAMDLVSQLKMNISLKTMSLTGVRTCFGRFFLNNYIWLCNFFLARRTTKVTSLTVVGIFFINIEQYLPKKNIE